MTTRPEGSVGSAAVKQRGVCVRCGLPATHRVELRVRQSGLEEELCGLHLRDLLRGARRVHEP